MLLRPAEHYQIKLLEGKVHTYLIKNLRSHKMLYATVWKRKKRTFQVRNTFPEIINEKIYIYNRGFLTCSAMMPNNPKQAYCTKFLLRMRTQPPVETVTSFMLLSLLRSQHDSLAILIVSKKKNNCHFFSEPPFSL